ncbi:hypothetical protein ES288_A12G130500v1 [Gossypium darwinii]|uniref:Uncharacterized protein n=1 Tax=Gossypium darwinii TaxID=34276 RepID=A0A5D2E968_GOSDA|nr:hypothetical protein ES288_A12G130500v1 [Gossypium darwinii]
MALNPFLGSISTMEKGPSCVATAGNPVSGESKRWDGPSSLERWRH